MKGNLSVLVAALAAGESMPAAAKRANMGLSTAKRRVANPNVQAAVEEAERELARRLTARYNAVEEAVLEKLAAFLAEDHGPALDLRGIEVAAKVAASRGTSAMHLRLLDVERRLSGRQDADDRSPADDGGWGVEP